MANPHPRRLQTRPEFRQPNAFLQFHPTPDTKPPNQSINVLYLKSEKASAPPQAVRPLALARSSARSQHGLPSRAGSRPRAIRRAPLPARPAPPPAAPPHWSARGRRWPQRGNQVRLRLAPVRGLRVLHSKATRTLRVYRCSFRRHVTSLFLLRSLQSSVEEELRNAKPTIS